MPWIEQLGDPDYATRRAATLHLLNDNSLTADRLTLLMAATNTTEQRHRLLNIAKHHILRRELAGAPPNVRITGGMGILHKIQQAGMLPQVDGAASVVITSLPGFPGYAAFEPGDLIIGINGKPWPKNLDQLKLDRALSPYSAGDEVSFLVIRDGQSRTATLTLAPSTDLRRMYQGSDGRLQRTYQRLWDNARADMLKNAPDLKPTPLPAATKPTTQPATGPSTAPATRPNEATPRDTDAASALN